MRFSPTKPFMALGLLALAMALMPFNDVVIKTIGPGHVGFSRLSIAGDLLSLTLLIFLRSFLILAVLLLLPATWRSFSGLGLRAWALLLVRGSLIGLSMVLLFIGLALLPLWQAVSVFFIAPLLISLLSVPFLGERLGLWRILAQLMGLGGVLVMVVPTGLNNGQGGTGGFDWSFLLPVLSALYYALYNLMTRLMGQTASTMGISTMAMTNIQHLGYMLVGLILALGVFALPFDTQGLQAQNAGLAFVLRPWAMPTAQQFGVILVCGGLIAFLSCAAANAYSNLEASMVAPFEYAYMPLSLFWSIVIWDEYPTWLSLLGGGLILGAGLLTVFRENIRGVDIATAAPMPLAAAAANFDTQDQ